MPVFCLLAATLATACLSASASPTEFANQLADASVLSSLTAAGGQPFHLKLEATDTRHHDPQYNAEIEVWWAAPDKWRRQVKSPAFSQTVIQNGPHYSESNSGDYLPWWLHELIQESVDPVPVSELKNEPAEPSGQGCKQWQSVYSKETEKIEIHNSVCFNPDGTLGKLFTRTVSAEFGDFDYFGHKRVARKVTVWPGGPVDVVANVTVLQKLKPKRNDPLFAVSSDTGIGSQVRFLSVPESALVPADTLATPNWPVLHNFPTTGAITINVKLDRNGNVREVGGIVSRNVVMTDAAREQSKTWKFKPYLSDGSPVQVNADITLRFEAKFELLGAANGKSYPAMPFLERVSKARELSGIRAEDGKPFQLQATLHGEAGTVGTYEEIWLSPKKWWRGAHIGAVTVVETRSDNNFYRRVTGADFSPREIDGFLDGIDALSPGSRSALIEADWGQSAVQFDGADMVRVARGEVDSKNQPISGDAYWFDSDGFLRGAFVEPWTVTCSNFVLWNGTQVPRQMEVRDYNGHKLTASIDQIESPADTNDALFVLQDVTPEPTGMSADYPGPPVVLPQPIYKVKPENPPAGHGTVLLSLKLDKHGHVLSTSVVQSAGDPLDTAAGQAAMQWEFTPTIIRGMPVNGGTKVQFDF